MYLELMTANLSLLNCRVLALEVTGVLGVTVSVVLGVFWIGAQRAAATGECCAGGDNEIRRRALLDPVDYGAEHVEAIERRPAAAMFHPGHEKDAAPGGDSIEARSGERRVGE